MIINRKKSSIQAIRIGPKRFITFLPGNNVISEADEELLIKNKTHKKLVENKIHVIIDQSKPNRNKSKGEEIPKNTNVVNEILKLSTKKARIIIEELYDKNILEQILDQDKRSGIQDSVFSQLKKLELPKELERKKDGIND